MDLEQLTAFDDIQKCFRNVICLMVAGKTYNVMNIVILSLRKDTLLHGYNNHFTKGRPGRRRQR